MFELPNAKRVRRSEVFDNPPRSSSASTSPSPSPPPPPQSSGQVTHSAKPPQFEFIFEDKTSRDKSVSEPAASANNEGEAEGDEGAYAFRLFRSPAAPAQPKPPHQQEPNHNELHDDEKNGENHAEPSPPPLPNAANVTRINIRSPTPPSSRSGGFVNPHRPQSYYFTFSANASGNYGLHKGPAAVEYAAVVVDGVGVRERASSVKWPGTALPFRVIHIPPSPSSSSTTSSLSQPHHALPSPLPNTNPPFKPRRCRASKKHRIALRKKFAATRRQEEADREKKTRRNREKKVKKRERERNRKMEIGKRKVGEGSEDGGKVEEGVGPS